MKRPTPTFVVNATITVLLVANLAVMCDVRRRLLNLVPKIPRVIDVPDEPPLNLAITWPTCPLWRDIRGAARHRLEASARHRSDGQRDKTQLRVNCGPYSLPPGGPPPPITKAFKEGTAAHR